jgi:hypothetical protein
VSGSPHLRRVETPGIDNWQSFGETTYMLRMTSEIHEAKSGDFHNKPRRNGSAQQTDTKNQQLGFLSEQLNPQSPSR